MIHKWNCKALFVVLPICACFISGCSVVGTWLNESNSVARSELGPKTVLKKYEWFKDASAELDKKKSDIKVYAVNLKDIEDAYTGKPRSEWTSDDRAEHNQLQAELNGIKASFNQLASEYNSHMVKINYSFANQGTLPEGASTKLPRKYKPYVTH